MPSTTKPSKISAYYNYAQLFARNGAYNFLLGGRGLGKTYGAQKKVIKDAIKTGLENGDQFIYMRRYKDELRMSRDTFFAAVQHEFPDWDFKVHGYEAKAAPASTRDEKKRQWHTIGYFIALSIAQSYKSVAFPRVKIIIFDEFIIEKGSIHYLPSEAEVFNNFYSTVDRYKDKTRVLFLANAVMVNNPYFIYYKIDPRYADDQGFLKMHKGFIICHFPRSDEFENQVFSTRFGSFIQGTEYAEYAVNNTFHDNHESMVDFKPSRASYMFTLETKTGIMSIWFDIMDGTYYVQAKRPKDENIITIEPGKMAENKTLMTFADKPLGMLRTAFRSDRVRFDGPPTRNAFLEIFLR